MARPQCISMLFTPRQALISGIISGGTGASVITYSLGSGLRSGSETMVCLMLMPALAITPVTSATIPTVWALLGMISMALQPMTGATSLSMAVGRNRLKTLI